MRERTPVHRVARKGDAWAVHTPSGTLLARAVVVATGGESVRGRPLAGSMPARLLQVHAADYRSPARLPGGAVLVVGSAESGYQIAEELLAAGRQDILATSAVGRAPARHRGRDTVEWLAACGFSTSAPPTCRIRR